MIRKSVSLRLARSWYVIVGAGALLLSAGHTLGAMTAGSRSDAPLVAAGVMIGSLSLAAAAWVVARGGARAALAWLGIAAALAPFAVASWIALTSASLDAQVAVAVPTLIALTAAMRMATARSKLGKWPETR